MAVHVLQFAAPLPKLAISLLLCEPLIFILILKLGSSPHPT